MSDVQNKMTYPERVKAVLDILADDMDGELEQVDKLEQLYAEEFGHVTVDGWCCACEADIAFMTQEAERLSGERKATKSKASNPGQ